MAHLPEDGLDAVIAVLAPLEADVMAPRYNARAVDLLVEGRAAARGLLRPVGARGREPQARASACQGVVLDGLLTLLTLASFTDAAHERNIEAGGVVHDPRLAERITRQFDRSSRRACCSRSVWGDREQGNRGG